MTSQMWRRLVPAAILLLGLALFLLFGLERYFSFEMLSRHHATLATWVADNTMLAVVLFVLAYALVVAFSLPIAIIITPLGGFLFGIWLGAILSVIGATLGSVAVFLAARTAFYDLFHARAGAALARFEDGFRRDSFSYLLFLRLVPAFPFFLVNLVPAFAGVRLTPFVAATALGVIPGALVYALAGSGLDSVIAAQQAEHGDCLAAGHPDCQMVFDAKGVLTPQLIGALIALGLLALVPVVVKRFRSRARAAL